MTTGSRRFSIEQAGRALGVSTATVWRMIRRGELPTVRDRGRRFVLAEGLASRARRHTRQDVPPLTGAHPIYWLVGAGRGGGRAPGAREISMPGSTSDCWEAACSCSVCYRSRRSR